MDMHLTDEMHRFALSKPVTPASPPTRFPPSGHDPTSFPDPSPPAHAPTRNLSLGSRSSTLSDGTYNSPITYPTPIESPLIISPGGRIEPGVYEIKNQVWGSVVDSNAGDKSSVIAFSYHGQANQQWEFSPLGKGWSIKNMATGLFLTVEKGIGGGVPLVASDFPVAWDVQVDNPDAGLVRIVWPNSEAVWDMQDGRSGTPIQLSNKYPHDDQDHKLWRLALVAKTAQSPNFTPDPDIPHSDHHGRHRHRHGNKHGHGHGPGPGFSDGQEHGDSDGHGHGYGRGHGFGDDSRGHGHGFGDDGRGRGRGRGHGRHGFFGHGHGFGHRGHAHGLSSDSTSDSDSDTSYTIVKTITKTKTKSKAKSKSKGLKGKEKGE